MTLANMFKTITANRSPKGNYPKLAIRPDKELFKILGYNGRSMFVLKGARKGQVKTLFGGRIYASVKTCRVFGDEFAWASHFGNWPLFKLWSKDGNPHNLAIDNLLPIRLKQYRERIIFEGGKYRHGLSKNTFLSEKLAKIHWRQCVSDIYAQDLQYCLQHEAQVRGDVIREDLPVFVETDPDIVPYVVETTRQQKPKVARNARAFWYGEKWVVVNEAKGPWDDYILRIKRALKDLGLPDHGPRYAASRAYKSREKNSPVV